MSSHIPLPPHTHCLPSHILLHQGGTFVIIHKPTCFCSVTQSCLTHLDPMDCSTPGFPVLHSWRLLKCHPTFLSSVVPFSSSLQSFSVSGSFLISWFFATDGQSIGASALASGLTGLISLQSKGLSRIFSNTTVQKHQFFSAQPSWWSKSHLQIGLLEKS